MSPGTKLVQPQRTGSQDSTADGIRKRVGKACDRCRMKKSRCDGSQPCLRCKADNTICVFGERKRSHDKVYPKGYVEMLEQQQSQLVSGLQELYKRLRDVEQWDGAVLTEVEGRPLTHDILASLRLLETKHDGDVEAFEENVEKLQARLLASGAGFTRRRGSISSESEQSQHGHARSASRDAPTASKPARSTTTSSVFGSSSMAGPAPVQVQAQPQRPTLLASNDSQVSQFSQMSQMSPLSGDPQFYEAEWAFPQAAHTTTGNKRMRAQFALQNERIMVANMATMQRQQHQQRQHVPSFDPTPWTSSPVGLGEMSASSDAWATQQFLGSFGGSATSAPRATVDAAITSDMDADQMDIDINQYIQSTAV